MIQPVFIFLFLSAQLAVADFRHHLVPDWIVVPGIIAGVFMTHNWLWAAAMLIPGIFLVGYEAWRSLNMDLVRWHGGDIKLGIMAGAFCGWKAFVILLFTVCFIKSFRFVFDNQKPLPVAPFMFVASLLTLATIRIP